MILTDTSLNRSEFERLLEDVHGYLNAKLPLEEAYFLTRGAQKLEEDLFLALESVAKGTLFEGKLTLISGHRFPDIVARVNQQQGFGLEVKTTKQDSWRCIGNSVLESTRVEGIERIYLFFGKLYKPVGFKWRLYQACLPDVSVTHSPRYQIDMDLPEGRSIFDKLGIPYDELRTSGNPIKPLVDYYKSQLKQGETLWWMGDESQGFDIKIKLFSNLEKLEKDRLRREMTCLFPEVVRHGRVTGGNKKFDRAIGWLVNQGIAATSLRDLFSAGGQLSVRVGSDVYESLPRQVADLLLDSSGLVSALHSLESSHLFESWGFPTNSKQSIEAVWMSLILAEVQTQLPESHRLSQQFTRVFQQALEMGCQKQS
jgi:hypothetical protein